MEFLDHGPLESGKLQLMGRVVGFSLCQAPTGVGFDSISPIIISLTENGPQPRPASVGMQFKRPRKIGIGKNGHCGAQAAQLTKHLLAPVILNDIAFFLPTFSLDISLCMGQATCANLGMNWQ